MTFLLMMGMAHLSALLQNRACCAHGKQMTAIDFEKFVEHLADVSGEAILPFLKRPLVLRISH